MKEEREVRPELDLAPHRAGAKKAPVVLAGGMKLHQLTLSSEAQLIATRGLPGRGSAEPSAFRHS